MDAGTSERSGGSGGTEFSTSPFTGVSYTTLILSIAAPCVVIIVLIIYVRVTGRGMSWAMSMYQILLSPQQANNET